MENALPTSARRSGQESDGKIAAMEFIQPTLPAQAVDELKESVLVCRQNWVVGGGRRIEMSFPLDWK
jgi:hypothetical protein